MVALERELGYRFRDSGLLWEALSHRSFIGAKGGDRLYSNERLEFLGDSVLDLIVAHDLFRRFPRSTEGELTQLKSLLVSQPILQRTAQDIGLGEALLLSDNEEATGGRARASILADALEALLGALYLDGGYRVAERFIHTRLVKQLPELARMPGYQNYKSVLLEHVQKNKLGHLSYRTTKEEGPDHLKVFTVEVLLNRKGLGEGRGDSKKRAQQEAARAALKELGINVNDTIPATDEVRS
jgi:ribonuclease-3